MLVSNSSADNKTSATRGFPKFLKVCLLIVVGSFLAYSVYWAAIIPFSTYGVFTFIGTTTFQNSAMNTPLSVQLILFQELAGAIAFLVNLIAAALAFKSTVQYIKNDHKWQTTLGKALITEAVFFLLFIPTTIHHMGGAFLSMAGADIFVGLSYLLQVLLIVPPFIVLGRKLKSHQNPASIQKWVCITAPLFVFAFWFKYLFLWIDTLSPLGPQQATFMSTVGAANSLLTLLIAGILTTFACLDFYKNKNVNKWFVSFTIILFGSHFIVYDLVSIWVPVYASFLYVTDFWMITLPIIGLATLKIKPNT